MLGKRLSRFFDLTEVFMCLNLPTKKQARAFHRFAVTARLLQRFKTSFCRSLCGSNLPPNVLHSRALDLLSS
jgi:hypothetical protein